MLRIGSRARAEGGVAAFDDFNGRQWPRLVYYLLERVRVRELAEDLAQEALARLWERRTRLDPDSSVAAARNPTFPASCHRISVRLGCMACSAVRLFRS